MESVTRHPITRQKRAKVLKSLMLSEKMKDVDYSSSITYNSGIKTPKEEKEPPEAIVAISTLRSMRFIALSSFLCKKRKKNRSFIILPPINHRRFFVIIIHNAVIIPNNTQFVQVFLQIFLDFLFINLYNSPVR